MTQCRDILTRSIDMKFARRSDEVGSVQPAEDSTKQFLGSWGLSLERAVQPDGNFTCQSVRLNAQEFEVTADGEWRQTVPPAEHPLTRTQKLVLAARILIHE